MATIQYGNDRPATLLEAIETLFLEDGNIHFNSISTSGVVTFSYMEWNTVLGAARDELIRRTALTSPRKCLVNGCTNYSDEGVFVDGLCAPCNDMLVTGRVVNGTTFIHSMQARLRKIADLATSTSSKENQP